MRDNTKTLFISLSFNQKVRKVIDYLFRSFPFNTMVMDYNEYWETMSQSNRPLSTFKHKLIGTIIKRGSRVLDVGCGDGFFLEQLSNPILVYIY